MFRGKPWRKFVALELLAAAFESGSAAQLASSFSGLTLSSFIRAFDKSDEPLYKAVTSVVSRILIILKNRSDILPVIVATLSDVRFKRVFAEVAGNELCESLVNDLTSEHIRNYIHLVQESFMNEINLPTDVSNYDSSIVYIDSLHNLIKVVSNVIDDEVIDECLKFVATQAVLKLKPEAKSKGATVSNIWVLLNHMLILS